MPSRKEELMNTQISITPSQTSILNPLSTAMVGGITQDVMIEK
jgi:hypothetical protein